MLSKEHQRVHTHGEEAYYSCWQLISVSAGVLGHQEGEIYSQCTVLSQHRTCCSCSGWFWGLRVNLLFVVILYFLRLDLLRQLLDRPSCNLVRHKIESDLAAQFDSFIRYAFKDKDLWL